MDATGVGQSCHVVGGVTLHIPAHTVQGTVLFTYEFPATVRSLPGRK